MKTPYPAKTGTLGGGRNKRAVLILLLSAAWLKPAAADEPKVELPPLSIGASYEIGTLQGGRFSTQTEAFKAEWVDNFGVFFGQSATLDERWFINVGLEGIFQFQKPEEITSGWGGTQNRNFFIGPATADLEYEAMGSSEHSWRIGLGMFRHKYNPDAANLGEYLFRTGPYPTYILTGIYSLVNNASAKMQGLKSRYSRGNFSADLFLTTETMIPPLYDISLAGMVKYGIADGLLDVGMGVNLKRILSVRPSRTTLQTLENAYFQGPDGLFYSGNQAYYRAKADFYAAKEREAGNLQDSSYYGQRRLSAQADVDNVAAWTAPGSAFAPGYSHFTHSGIILNALAALDLKKLLPQGLPFGKNDLRIYFEGALLGVKDYPVFYTNWRERLPLMVGVNLPGFGMLDLIAVQYENFASPHINSYSENTSTNGATPHFAANNDGLLSGREYGDGLSKDDHSWSVLVKKEVTRGLTLSAQAARDHTRMVSKDTYAGPGLDPNVVFYTSGKDNWYWMLQFGFGI